MVDLSPIETAGILRGLSKPDLAELSEIAYEQEFDRKDRLFERGERANTFYIAQTGLFALTVEVRVFDRSSEIVLEEKGPLDAFGWSSLVEPRTSIYSGYCIEAGSVVAFSREQLEALMMANRRLGEELLHNLTELIATRARVLQQLWVDEVSQSMSRVQHWSQSEVTTHWAHVMRDHGRSSVLGWIRR